ncbi:hypothetical protein RQP46_005004 [Phenoliferia psychrophenolica]
MEEDGSPPLVLSASALIAWCFAIISVLHAVPPPGVKRRTGHYSALPTDEEEAPSEARAPEDKIDRRGWMALAWSFTASVAATLLSLAFPVIYAVPIFNVFGNWAHDWMWWFTPSFSYIGQGIIMGLPTTASMNLGMLFGWAILSPLSKHQGWAPGPVSSTADGARGWILWPALAIMMAESVLSISMVTISTLFPTPPSEDATLDSADDAETEKAEDEADIRIVLGGVVLSCVSCVVLVAFVFGEDGIKWWATIIALVLASLFSILGVSAIGKISQLLFAIVQPGNVVANLVAGGISEAGAQQAGDLMQDLKTGHLHNASPKHQFYGQMIGSFASVFVSSGIYVLYRRVYELPSTSFPVPTAAIWLNLARLVNNGKLPPRSKETMALFGGAFLILAAVKIFAASGRNHRATKIARWIPSGTAFAIGFLNTPSFSIARLIGGLISYYMTRKRRSHHPDSTTPSHLENINLIIVASGFVLGEGIASIRDMDDQLRCNSLSCRKQLLQSAVVTTCSHVFCPDCATALFHGGPGIPHICPACQTELTESDDVVLSSLNPPNSYKTSVLSGLHPSIIFDIAARALNFYQYQASQEAAFQSLVARKSQERIAVLEAQSAEQDLETERRRVHELQETHKQNSRAYTKLKSQLDKALQRSLRQPAATNAFNDAGGSGALHSSGPVPLNLGHQPQPFTGAPAGTPLRSNTSQSQSWTTGVPRGGGAGAAPRRSLAQAGQERQQQQQKQQQQQQGQTGGNTGGFFSGFLGGSGAAGLGSDTGRAPRGIQPMAHPGSNAGGDRRRSDGTRRQAGGVGTGEGGRVGAQGFLGQPQTTSSKNPGRGG